MGAIIQVGSDQYPCTIVAIERRGHTLIVIKDRVVSKGIYVPNKGGRHEKFTLRGDGKYRATGSSHFRLYVGERGHYFDPSF